jgi:xylulokinase
MSTTGGCVQWFCDQFTADGDQSTVEIFQRLDRDAADSAASFDGLFCIPSLVGERAPRWESQVRGAFVGLSPRHQRRHLFRAILEGSAFAAKYMLNCLEQQGVQISQLLVVGGGAKSRLWNQIRADICGKTIVVPKIDEATSLGTAVLAGLGCGLFTSCAEAIATVIESEEIFEPNEQARKEYERHFDSYCALYDSLQGHFQGLPDHPAAGQR